MMRTVLRLEKARLGQRGISKMVKALTFTRFAKKMPNRQTEYDWLSRDPAEVQKYIEDPLCGHDSTVQLWCDLLCGLIEISGPNGLRTLDEDLPLLMFYGEADPMGDMGKGPQRMAKQLRHHRPQKLRIDSYIEGRHELLNDTNRDQVTSNLAAWLKEIHRR